MRGRRDEASMEERFLGAGAVEPRTDRRPVPAFVRFLAAGILRLVVYTAIAAAIAGGGGLVWGALRGSDDLLHSFVVGLWVGGAAMVGIAALTGGRDAKGHSFDRTHFRYRDDLGEDLGEGGGGAEMGVILAVGILLIAIGIGIDVLQRG